MQSEFQMMRSRLPSWVVVILGCGLALSSAHGEYELKAGSFNLVFQGLPVTVNGETKLSDKRPVGSNQSVLPRTEPQFAGVGPITGGVAASMGQSTTLDYPKAVINLDGASTGSMIVLQRATFGGVFAVGVPRYFFGDVILPPAEKIGGGVIGATETYWRRRPVVPGEILPESTSPVVPLTAIGSVRVVDGGGGYSSTPRVSFTGGGGDGASAAATVVQGRITAITVLSGGSGYTSLPNIVITDASGTGASAVAGGQVPYYYSEHAEKVFASQSGRVSITWVTNAPPYQTKTELFTVSSTALKASRTIYWTERNFSGPKVRMPSSIETVNPIGNTFTPLTVSQEYVVPGVSSDPNTAITKTLWFERTGGIGELHAYNVQGKMMVEYLGQLKAGRVAEREFLGADIIEIAQVAPVANARTELGDEIKPSPAGRTDWIAMPVQNTGVAAEQFYGSSTRSDGRSIYYAERKNDNPDRVIFYWLEPETAEIYFQAVAPNLEIFWPKQKNAYTFDWPTDLSRFAHYTVGSSGSSAATGLQFPGGQLPVIVYQDDGAQAAASSDLSTQRLVVSLAGSADGRNQSLLKFTSGSEVWYVRIYTQADGRAGFQEGDGASAIVENATVGNRIEAPGYGYVTAPNVAFSEGGGSGAAATAIIDPKTRRITEIKVTAAGKNYTTAPKVTISGGGGKGAVAAATVVNGRVTGVTLLNTLAGYIQSGTSHLPGAYADPFAVGITAAEKKAIIPVNAMPGNNVLRIWWFQAVQPPSTAFAPFYVPAKTATYTVSYPVVDPATQPNDAIVLASNVGSGDLSPSEGAGTIYVQNDRALPGFNPNEEHALMIAGRAYALRDDLNVQGSGADATKYTSEPFVLVQYTSPDDQRPAVRTFKVVREIPGKLEFKYDVKAGTILQGPMPLPVLSPRPVTTDGKSRDFEVGNVDVPLQLPPNDARYSHYSRFTFKDRKGYDWVYRGPHGGGSPTFGMRFFYLMQNGFYVPGQPVQPEVGKAILPYLRPLANGVPQGDPIGDTPETPQTIIYRPLWPTSAPELRVAETLTKPKFGLPKVRARTSAEVLYQQSIAVAGPDRTSVVLHDPIREKEFVLAAGALAELPPSILTTSYQGKTYFQRLPPHLQTRFFFDPLRGPTGAVKGALVLLGSFADEPAGEDYVNLNVLSSDDKKALLGLVEAGADGKSQWDSAIGQITTTVKTYKEDPVKRGAYIVDDAASTIDGQPIKVNGEALVEVGSSETAVADYALTARGEGDGWVTMLFANGKAFTPPGDPVEMKIFKVAKRLYTGELKAKESSNPLDEQVTLRHTADFAARPQDYEFEWRYSPPIDGQPSPIYTYTIQSVPLVGNAVWVRSPQGALPSEKEYAAGLSAAVARTVEIYPFIGSVSVTNGGSKYDSAPPVSFSGGGGQGAAAVATISAQGVVTGIELTNPGTGYTSVPTVTIGESGGIRASAVANRQAVESVSTRPGLVVRLPAVDFTAGVPVRIFVTAELGDHDGFILYVNGSAALTYNLAFGGANTPASEKLVPGGLRRQFEVSDNFFAEGMNQVEVALFSTADVGAASGVNFQLHASAATDRVAGAGSSWLTPGTGLKNTVVVGGSPSAPLGSPLLVMSDNYFTMRYRPKKTIESGPNRNIAPRVSSAADSEYRWSRWMEPKLVEGWIKRVLKGINPFNQRVKDLYNNAVNTDVSILTQAGKRWEGDVALSLADINNAGLIEIYETVLNRGKLLSVDSGYDYGPANDALLLAAGYLNDLYTALGNEAYADAANPTISIDGGTTAGEVNTSRFSFEGQVTSVLEEELALLRGRDDFLAPGVKVSPAYNRLYWNYTRGINSGEALYAVNYNIKEKSGSPTADGNIDAADAQRMFPQGHGDAYGHYLTALTGYYRLLHNRNFTWTPRSETVTVLGQAVAVDYFDERKFADAAANVGRTAQQVIALTHRQSYQDDPSTGWAHFRDGKENPNTGNRRDWGLDEWSSRAGQGTYYHWVVGNALLPDKDTNPTHTGVQVIDRSRVPALAELAALGTSFQTTMDVANAHLNPLGLSPGAIAFDISPAELKAGKSHYEQVYERALRAVLNARGAFDQAARMTRLLRTQENQVDSANTALVDQENAFRQQLIEIYGTPYPGDIGPGKTYAQGYNGPDLKNWFVIDRPTGFIDTATPVEITLRVGLGLREPSVNTMFTFADYNSAYYDDAQAVEKKFMIQPNSIVQYADTWAGVGANLGSRRVVGKLQEALLDAHQARTALLGANDDLGDKQNEFRRRHALFLQMIEMQRKLLEAANSNNETLKNLDRQRANLSIASEFFSAAGDSALDLVEGYSESLPGVTGLDNDVTASARGAIKTIGASLALYSRLTSAGLSAKAQFLETEMAAQQNATDYAITQLGFNYEQAQAAFEYEFQLRSLISTHYALDQLATDVQRKMERVRSLLAEAEHLETNRELFRQRAAAVIQGYRTNDFTFRAFRNEGLEQYRSLFDLASRYTYLAAKSYDYETGLLGSTAGQAVFNSIVASRSLGDLSGKVPQAPVNTLGDAGLAGTMARMEADWSVAKGRLGINNPDQNGTLFSLRRELFKLLDDPTRLDDNAAWQTQLEQHRMANVLEDPDVVALCRNIKKADGSPVPGFVIPFATAIEHGLNFFGKPTADGDHAFTASNFATKIYSAGIVFRGYIGMDSLQAGSTTASVVFGATPNALSATPYAYLIPTGTDYMRAPPLGDTDVVRGWKVADQAFPLPFNLGASSFSTTQFFNANGTLSEAPWVLRKHQAFRPVDDPALFYGTLPAEFTSSRLVGRSVWNTGWKLVIPAYTLHSNEQEGLNRFVASVTDIQLFLRTYSHSGN